MKIKIFITILLLFSVVSSCFSQKRAITKRRIFNKAEFIHTWNLVEIRNQSNDLVTKKVDKKMIQFTNDSVFIFKNKQIYKGTWTFEKGQFQITIPECLDCNYKWSVFDDSEKIICFRVGNDNSRLECFKRKK